MSTSTRSPGSWRASAACAGGSGPEDAFKQLTRVDYGKAYIGMSKAEVLQCAGQPRSVLPAGGGAETLVYRYNGAGPVPGGGSSGKKDKKDKKDKKSGLLGKTTEKGLTIVPLIGARTRPQLTESLGALDVALSNDDIARIEETVPASAVAGTRYDEHQMRILDSERA